MMIYEFDISVCFVRGFVRSFVTHVIKANSNGIERETDGQIDAHNHTHPHPTPMHTQRASKRETLIRVRKNILSSLF